MTCRFTTPASFVSRARSVVAVLTLIFALPYALPAQPGSWTLVLVDTSAGTEYRAITTGLPGSLEAFHSLASGSALRACRPVGVESDGETGLLLCSADGAPGPWFVTAHEDWNSLQAHIDAHVGAGLRPLDVSHTGSSLAILWAEDPGDHREWRLGSCEESVSVLRSTIHAYGNKGFQLVGISANDGLFWLLFARAVPGASSSAVVSVPSADLATEDGRSRASRALATASSSGWTLSGIATGAGSLHLVLEPSR